MSVVITMPNIHVNLHTFSGGEVHVQLENLLEDAPKRIDVRADIRSSDDLMALLLVNNALRNHYGKTPEINIEIPYFPYARQDRVCSVGQAFSLQVVAKMIDDLKANSITVWDAHSPVTQALTGAMNVSQEQIIASSNKLVAHLQDDNTVLVCPDKGAKKKCDKVKKHFSIEQMIFSEKERDPSTGEITDTTLSGNDLKGKTAIIIDDICDGGRTFIEIAKRLKTNHAERVILYITHGIFSKGMEVFDGLIDEIYTTNSFPQEEDSRLTVIDFSVSA
ncbi:MAG: ribose-phosphate diphosphokinase [Cocleimonas sp.]|nr:ribose-phosphate diphosphokinase [Cocleimonas sp.]